MNKCPYCLEEVHIDAFKCKHCGENIKHLSWWNVHKLENIEQYGGWSRRSYFRILLLCIILPPLGMLIALIATRSDHVVKNLQGKRCLIIGLMSLGAIILLFYFSLLHSFFALMEHIEHSPELNPPS